MTLLLLVRHASTDWVGRGLAGRMPGVGLSDKGRVEIVALQDRLAGHDLVALYASPLERTMTTAAAIAVGRPLAIQPLPAVQEVDFGEWTGRTLDDLRRDPLWPVVQSSPSRMRFPGGESPLEVQARAVAAIEEVLARHPAGAVGVVSHADVIKILLATYAGAPLDAFQRFDVAPASISAIQFQDGRPTLLLVNHCGALPQPIAPLPVDASIAGALSPTPVEADSHV